MATVTLKKLGAKQILGNVAALVKSDLFLEDGDVVDCYTIYGFSNGYTTGQSNYGAWVKFVGNVEGINHISGEIFSAREFFIPEPLSGMLAEALDKREETDTPIQFGATVAVKRRDSLPTGYEYIVKPHVKQGGADPLAALREEIRGVIGDIVPRLAGPREVGTFVDTESHYPNVGNTREAEELAKAPRAGRRK